MKIKPLTGRIPRMILACLALFIFSASTFLQEPYRLNVHRNYGFSSGSQIRGSFSLDITGDLAQVSAVKYMLDGKAMAEVTQPPFSTRFDTSQYALGEHKLSAVINLKNGTSLNTDKRQYEFVSSEAEFAAVRSIIFPLGGGVFLIILIMVGIQILGGRSRRRDASSMPEIERFSHLGGAICPKCGAPTPLHWWALNLSFNKKYDRCEECGKWSLVARVDSDRLAEIIRQRAAEGGFQRYHLLSPEEEFLKKLEESRYITEL